MGNNIQNENGDDNNTIAPLTVEPEIVSQISEISKNSRTTFFAILIACAYSYLTISTTNDTALLTNTSAMPLPIIQVKVPIVWFYYLAPIILTVLFFYFHFYLENFWRSIIRLPLYHTDDRRGLDVYVYPWLISNAFIRGGNSKLSQDRPLARLEYIISLLLGWFIIPVLLFFFWGRYLNAHEWKGTLLHSILLMLTIGFAFRFYYLAKNAVLAIPDNSEVDNIKLPVEKEVLTYKWFQIAISTIITFIVGVVIAYYSHAAIYGFSKSNTETVGKGLIRIILDKIDDKFIADISNKKIVAKPPNWLKMLDKSDDLDRYLENQNRLYLSGRNLQRLKGQHAFIPGSSFKKIIMDYAELQHAILTKSRLESVRFREANLTHAGLQYATIIATKFEEVYADVIRFNHSQFWQGIDGVQTVLSGGYYIDANFEHCKGKKVLFQKADLREANFNYADFENSTFQSVDLSGAKFIESELRHSKFFQTDFTKTAIKTADLSFSEFDECKFNSTAISDVIFEDATITNSEFNHLKEVTPGNNSKKDRNQTSVFRNKVDLFNGKRIKLKECQIYNTHFTEAELILAEFNDVTFENCRFSDTDMSAAKFVKCKFYNSQFTNTDLISAEFHDVKFKNCRFSGSDMSNAKLINTDLSSVKFEKVQFKGINLENVTGLSKTDLKSMHINKKLDSQNK